MAEERGADSSSGKGSSRIVSRGSALVVSIVVKGLRSIGGGLKKAAAGGGEQEEKEAARQLRGEVHRIARREGGNLFGGAIPLSGIDTLLNTG